MRPSPATWLTGALAAALLPGPASAGDAPAPAGPEAAPGTALTVYSSADPRGFDPQRWLDQARQGASPTSADRVPGFGVVKVVRDVDLREGTNALPFEGVAAFVDPTTVSFADLTSASTTVLEQAFRFDLASPDKILERYLGRSVALETAKDGQPVGRVEGRVLSVNQGTVVLQAEDGLRFVPARDPGLRLPALPQGLLTKPTLVWKVEAETAGTHRIRTTYQTSGLTWRADYNLVLSAGETSADLSAWVTLLNLSGASYLDARLKLVAGDVQRITPPADLRERLAHAGKPAGPAEPESGFEEKSFFEYHLYTLPRRTDLPDSSTQQITLFPTARGVPVEKVLVYYGLPSAASWGAFPSPRTDRDLGSRADHKVDVHLRLRNEQAKGLGMPLPKGKVRVYQADEADGTPEFVGEDLIDHTARDEKVLVRVGQAFDVVGDRVQTRFETDTAARKMSESFRVSLRNHKPTPVRVLVKENLYRWTAWDVVEASDPFTKVDARTVTFDVVVPPDGAKDVTYTVCYTW